MDGLAGRVFRGHLHPVELGVRLAREADLAVFPTPAGPGTANLYTLHVNPADLADRGLPPSLAQELAASVEELAADRGWRLEGPAAVILQLDDRVSSGSVEVHAEVRPGEPAAWSFLVGRHRLALRYNRSLVGRSSACDVNIEDPGVSRRHALIWREAGQAFIQDLDSANGTLIDGEPIAAPELLPSGTVVSFGPATYTFRTA